MSDPIDEDWFPDGVVEDLEAMKVEIVSMNPNWDEKRLKKTVPIWYSEGILKEVCKEIDSLLSIAGITHKVVAEFLGVTRQAVDQWFNGETVISGRSFAGLQQRYHRQLGTLYPGNARQLKERAASGYREIMFSLRHLVMEDRECIRPPTRDEFFILYHLLQNEEWLCGNRSVGFVQILVAIGSSEGIKVPSESRGTFLSNMEQIQKLWSRPYFFALALSDAIE